VIVVRITGGLGNQMFQYAAGRALAERHGVPLRLDLDEYGRATVHEGYVLDRAFGVRARAMGPLGRALVAAWRLQPGRPRWVVRLDPRVPGAAPHELLERAPAACYLNGYWQDERCFAPIAASVRRELTVADTALADLGPLATRVQDEASVAVHVRRGDYLGIGLGHFVQLGPDHYAEAARLVAARVADPTFVVFSDDPAWCDAALVRRGVFPGPVELVAPRPGRPAWLDQAVMARCRHHIIANSSFSWWAAWLAAHDEQVVVAPARWYLDPVAEASSSVVPARWLRC